MVGPLLLPISLVQHPQNSCTAWTAPAYAHAEMAKDQGKEMHLLGKEEVEH